MKKSYVELKKENEELRKEVGTLHLVNLDCAKANEGLLEEHKQLLKLRSKINNNIEEIKQEIQNGAIKITSGNERLFNILENIED